MGLYTVTRNKGRKYFLSILFIFVRFAFTRFQNENFFKIFIPHKLLSSAAALLTGSTPFQQLESSAMQLLVRPPSLIERNSVSTSCCDNVMSYETNTAYHVHHKLMFTPHTPSWFDYLASGLCSSTSTQKNYSFVFR